MTKILKRGKALYEVSNETKTYRYNRRNPEKISKEEEEQNRRKIDGFTGLFKDGKTKKFRDKR